MSINNDDRSNFIGIYVKDGDQLREIKKGCVIIDGQIKYFYGMDNSDSILNYTLIKYIINNRNSDGYNETYIDTGLTMTNDRRVDIIFTPTRNLNSDSANKPHVIIYMGEQFYLMYEYDTRTTKDRSVARLKVGNISASSIYDIPKGTNKSFYFNNSLNQNIHRIYYKTTSATTGTLTGFSNTRWDEAINSCSTNNICLLGAPYGNNIFPTQYPNTKLFSCQIYNDISKNEMLRNFIPVRRNSDNRLGLYDTVYNKFYPNAYPDSEIDFIYNDDEYESEDDPCKTRAYCVTDESSDSCATKDTCSEKQEECPYSCWTETNWCPQRATDGCTGETCSCNTQGCANRGCAGLACTCDTQTSCEVKGCQTEDELCPNENNSISNCGCFRDCGVQSGRVFATPAIPGEYDSQNNRHYYGSTGQMAVKASNSEYYNERGGDIWVPWGWYDIIGYFNGGNYDRPVISVGGQPVVLYHYNYDGSGCPAPGY